MDARLASPATWLAAKMMQLIHQLYLIARCGYAIWECHSRAATRVPTSCTQFDNTTQLDNAAMTRICGILHIGSAHRASHEGDPLCRKKESAYPAYLRQGVSIGPATPCRHSAPCMLAHSARARRGYDPSIRLYSAHSKPKRWRWLFPGFWGLGYQSYFLLKHPRL